MWRNLVSALALGAGDCGFDPAIPTTSFSVRITSLEGYDCRAPDQR